MFRKVSSILALFLLGLMVLPSAGKAERWSCAFDGVSTPVVLKRLSTEKNGYSTLVIFENISLSEVQRSPLYTGTESKKSIVMTGVVEAGLLTTETYIILKDSRKAYAIYSARGWAWRTWKTATYDGLCSKY